MKPTHKTT